MAIPAVATNLARFGGGIDWYEEKGREFVMVSTGGESHPREPLLWRKRHSGTVKAAL
jgi:hypothetical protein